MNLDRVKELVALSNEPLEDEWLEGVNAYHEPYRRVLYHLILEMKPEAVLELGVAEGYTTAHMAAAAAKVGALCVGVDVQPCLKVAAELAGRYGNYRHVHCDSLGAVQTVRKFLGGRRIGVILQDSSHHVEPSRLEWRYYAPLLEPGAVWICDDVTPAFQQPDEPWSMVDYFSELPGKKALFPGLHIGNVMGVVIRG